MQLTNMSQLIHLQMEKCAQDLGNSTKAVSSAIAHLLGEVAQGNENYTGTGFHNRAGGRGTELAGTDLSVPPGIAAREVAQALRSLSQAARGVAANTSDPQAQSAMLECASDVMDKANNLIEEARKEWPSPVTQRASSAWPRWGPWVPQCALSGCGKGVRLAGRW